MVREWKAAKRTGLRAALCRIHQFKSKRMAVPHLHEALVNADAKYQAGGPSVTKEEIVTFHNHLVDVLVLRGWDLTARTANEESA